MDQAEELRKMVKEKAFEQPNMYAFLRASGGIGATFLLSNMAVLLATEGKRVLFVDIGNRFVLPSLLWKESIDVNLGNNFVKDFRPSLNSKFGFVLSRLDDLSWLLKERGVETLGFMRDNFDICLLDIPCLLPKDVLFLSFCKNTPYILTTPHPRALIETYGMIKMLMRNIGLSSFNVVINGAVDQKEGKEAYLKLKDLLESRHDVSMKLSFILEMDPKILAMERAGESFALRYKDSSLSLNLKKLYKEWVREREFKGIHEDE